MTDETGSPNFPIPVKWVALVLLLVVGGGRSTDALVEQVIGGDKQTVTDDKLDSIEDSLRELSEAVTRIDQRMDVIQDTYHRQTAAEIASDLVGPIEGDPGNQEVFARVHRVTLARLRAGQPPCTSVHTCY